EVQTELKEEKKILYQRYLLDNLSEFLDECIAKKDISIIMEMGRQGLLDSERIGLVIRKMTQAGWVEGTRAIITGRSTGWQE
ncbi:MAG: hypothetical protein K5639_00300, partial [Eubacterium sp.]|nr:hypothetical protein [Eubacterium sp.]